MILMNTYEYTAYDCDCSCAFSSARVSRIKPLIVTVFHRKS